MMSDDETRAFTSLADCSGVPGLTPIFGGFRVKTVGAYHVDVLRMLVNWRLVTTPVAFPDVVDRGWCYLGTGPVSFVAVVLAANAWDVADDTEPAGWFKNLQTGELRTWEGGLL